MFFGAQHGLVGVIDDQVRVEHMFFGAQHGLHGVKSVLSICFFCAEHGLHNCESHPKRITFAQHGLSKSVLSMFTGWFCESAQHGLAKSVLRKCFFGIFGIAGVVARVSRLYVVVALRLRSSLNPSLLRPPLVRPSRGRHLP
jgi:hypothetical protein